VIVRAWRISQDGAVGVALSSIHWSACGRIRSFHRVCLSEGFRTIDPAISVPIVVGAGSETGSDPFEHCGGDRPPMTRLGVLTGGGAKFFLHLIVDLVDRLA
jgi:hypothetical protein